MQTTTQRAAEGAAGKRLLSMLRQRVVGVLDVRHVEVFVDRGGRLCPLGETAGAHVVIASLLLASVNMRVQSRNFFAPGIPAPTILRAVPRSGRGSIMAVPLLHGRRPLGLLVVEGKSEHDFGAGDLRRLEEIAAMGVAALLGAVSLLEQEGPEDLGWELADAVRLQRSFLPHALPVDSQVIAHAVYEPAGGLGGDFYDLVPLAPTRVGVLIGDVSGHDVRAALLMSRVSAELRDHAIRDAAPAALLEAVNDRYAGGDGEMYVTAAYARVDVASGSVEIANAGHVPAVLRRADGHAAVVGRPSGTPLGMFAAHYRAEEVAFAAGDVLLLVTDGVFDTLGLPGLCDVVAAAPPEARALAEAVMGALTSPPHCPPRDDVTVVAIQPGTSLAP